MYSLEVSIDLSCRIIIPDKNARINNFQIIGMQWQHGALLTTHSRKCIPGRNIKRDDNDNNGYI